MKHTDLYQSKKYLYRRGQQIGLFIY